MSAVNEFSYLFILRKNKPTLEASKPKHKKCIGLFLHKFISILSELSFLSTQPPYYMNFKKLTRIFCFAYFLFRTHSARAVGFFEHYFKLKMCQKNHNQKTRLLGLVLKNISIYLFAILQVVHQELFSRHHILQLELANQFQ